MPRTPEEMVAAIARNLPQRTGRTLAEWVAIVKAQEGLTRYTDKVEWLKREHGLGHSTASIVVSRAEEPEDYVAPAPEELVAAQYAGAKAALRPIYERLIEAVKSLGADVQVEPRQTYVSLASGTQFAVVQPSTRARVDLGLKLRGVEPTARLQPAGSFGSGNITYRVALTSPDDVDAEVLGWLRAAYEASA